VLVGPESGSRRRPLFGRFDVTLAAIAICTIAAGVSCPAYKALRPDPTQTNDEITLFFSGDELGALKPCGCSSGQLGGLEKRPAVFDETPASRRMTIETGDLVEGDGPEDLIKFRIFCQAFALIGYDVVHLAPHDVGIVESLGLLKDQDQPYAVIAAQRLGEPPDRPSSFSKDFVIGGRKVTVIVAVADTKTDSPERIHRLWRSPSGQTVKVLILQNSYDSALGEWVLSSGADCVVCPSRVDDPELLSEPGAKPLVFTTGRFGRHIRRLDVTLSPDDEGLGMQLTDVPLVEKLPDNAALVRLYKQYQVLVKDAGLLKTFPRVPLPDYLRYVGSANCESCHLYEYTLWSTKAHAHAFASLEKVGSDYDPECVICHVVGMDRESGFVTSESTPQMENVGCEVCHGPGSEHIRAGGHVPTTEPKASCTQCHTPEQSNGYAGHEDEYLRKIVHWWEP
jgi:hypothetical protein